MKPKRSKAFIITFIIVLILLIAGYFLVVKGGILKNENSIGKKFAPLLGTPKEKDVIVGDNIDVDIEGQNTQTGNQNDPNNPNTDGSQNPNDPNSSGSGTNTTPGSTNSNIPTNNKPKYTPPNLSFPTPSTTPVSTQPDFQRLAQCEDGIDNDGDGFIDSADKECHSDGNAKNLTSYVAKYNTELGATVPDPTKGPANTKNQISCGVDEVPLVFTAAEQAELDKLTNEFYRLAPQLKSENDILSELASDLGYKEIIANAENLESQCRAQTSTPQYLQNNLTPAERAELFNITDNFLVPSRLSTKVALQPEDPVNPKRLFTGWLFDDMDATARAKVDWSLESKNRQAFIARYFHAEYLDFVVKGNVIISTQNKGRTERLRNPYYNSSKEVYPFNESTSYFEQYYRDPRNQDGSHTRPEEGVYNAQIWDWPVFEKDKKIW